MKRVGWLFLLPILAGMGCLTLGQQQDSMARMPEVSPPPVVTPESINEENVLQRISELQQEMQFDAQPAATEVSNPGR